MRESKSPKVSIIMPTYNRGYIIGKAIDSVMEQNYKDYELVIIDDGSTDNTEEVVSSYKDVAINYIKLGKNSGATRARNIGMINAKGENFAFLDSDVIWMPDYLELSMKEFDDGADCTFGRVKVFVDEKRQIVYPETGKDTFVSIDDIVKYQLLSNAFDTNTVCIKRKCWKECGGFSEKQEKLQDWEYFTRIAGTKKFKIRFIDKVIAHSFYQKDSLSHNDSLMFDARFNIFKHNISEYRKYGLVENFLRDILPYNRTFKNYETNALYTKFSKIFNIEEMDMLQRIWNGIYKKDCVVNQKENNSLSNEILNKYMFPFHLFQRGENIFVFGEEKIITSFREQLSNTQYVKVEGVISYNENDGGQEYLQRVCSNAVNSHAFNVLLLAIENEQNARKVKKIFCDLGVNAENIVWDGNAYKRGDFQNNIYFNMLDFFYKQVERNNVERNNVEKIEASPMFDGEWYREQYGDSDLGDMMPAEHYYTIGWKKGYNPSPRFDTSWYLERYKDVEVARVCPLVHYINFGKDEGRQPLKEHDIKDLNKILCLPTKMNDMTGKRIDIIVPIYNAVEHLKKCLDSVLRNTSVDYELYLINDKSTDENVAKYLKKISKTNNIHLKKMHVIENTKNVGFVKSVNKGLKLSNNDVIILNTDTEVPPHWVERFVDAYENDDKIASITPFSNSATICSFPNFNANNDIYKGKSVEDIDKIFDICNFNKPIDIPTAVGFCMFMSRKSIDDIGVFDEVFNEGYGEENDWCMRATRKGYKNVFLTNLFIYHKHGASFNEKGSKEREALRNRNRILLSKRYPDYDAMIQKHIKENPVDSIRQILRWRLDNFGEPIVFIMPRLGGGVKVYQDAKIEKEKKRRTVYAMFLENNLKTLVIRNESLSNEQLVFDFSVMSAEMFARLLGLLGVREIFINHLIRFPLSKTMSYIMDSGIPYSYFVHDFYSVCPKYALIDGEGKYCGAEKSTNICDKCFYRTEKSSDCIKTSENINNIFSYRGLFALFFQNAKNVIAPSQFVKKVINKYYPTCNVKVEEHKLGEGISKTFREDFVKDKVLYVTVLGAINKVKGYDVVFDLAKKISRSDCKIVINAIGSLKSLDEPFEEFGGTLCGRGTYNRKDVSLKLAEYKTSIVLIPSIWPETFSYTTHEAIESGYPVLCFDLGAPGEFVKKTGMGWVLSDVCVDALYKQLVYLYNNREEILKAAKMGEGE